MRGRDTPHPHYVTDRHLSSSHPIDTPRQRALLLHLSPIRSLWPPRASSSPLIIGQLLCCFNPTLKDFETRPRVQNCAKALFDYFSATNTNLGELQVGEHQQQLPPCLEGEGPAILLAAEDGARVGWTGGGSACPRGTAPRRVLPPFIGGRGSGGGIQCSCCS